MNGLISCPVYESSTIEPVFRNPKKNRVKRIQYLVKDTQSFFIQQLLEEKARSELRWHHSARLFDNQVCEIEKLKRKNTKLQESITQLSDRNTELEKNNAVLQTKTDQLENQIVVTEQRNKQPVIKENRAAMLACAAGIAMVGAGIFLMSPVSIPLFVAATGLFIAAAYLKYRERKQTQREALVFKSRFHEEVQAGMAQGRASEKRHSAMPPSKLSVC